MTTVKRPQRVGELMLRDFVTVSPGTTLIEAESVVRSARLRHLLVVDGGIVIGLVSHRDLLDEFLAASHGLGGADRLRSITIEHLVRADLVTIGPEASLEEAASRMLALRIGCLPVVIRSTRGPRLVGLVTEADLLRAAYLPAPPAPPA